jgi:serine/threonine-protein kinase
LRVHAPTERLIAALATRYRIERELGAGGMATVYLAADLKHGRSVAIKVLKPELAAVLGADRFVQEIRTTASLTHPHILPLFDSGEADGFLYYVMPYLEGETIRERLNRETQLGVADAVRITTEVADALEYAHRHGVIHRDIKPENILLHEGRPMVMDFGIALAVSAAAGGRMTETGLSLGTPHYMSPEQATAAKTITARSDIYSLACVLYEMLAGEPPHTGPTAQAIIMKIVAEPASDVRAQRQAAPPNIAAALARALERLPADRFDSATEFAHALASPSFRNVAAGGTALATPDASVFRWWVRSPWSWAALTALLVASALPVLLQGGAGVERPAVMRFAIPVDTDARPGHDPKPFARMWQTEVAISPDGSRLVYAAWGPDSAYGLYQRRLDQAKAELLVPGARYPLMYERPFFSPDGAWLGFVAWEASGVTLRRLRLADGLTETIGPLTSFAGATRGPSGWTGPSWGDDGTIVIATPQALYRIPESGGEWTKVAEAPADSGIETRWYQPHLLPRSRTVLLHAARSFNPEDADIVALDLDTGSQRTVVANGMNPLYLSPGYLLFVRQGVLMSVQFDPGRVATSGQPVVLIDDVMHAVGTLNSAWETGAAQAAVSSGGTLVWAKGGIQQPFPLRVIRVTDRGDSIPLDLERRTWVQFRLAPDGGRLAAVSRKGLQHEMWIHDFDRGVTRRLNGGGSWNYPLEWSPDGRWILFSSDRERTGRVGLYRMAADGSGLPERVVPPAISANSFNLAGSWSSQGVIAYISGTLTTADIWVVPPDGKPASFVASDSADWFPSFSPDGRWLAYMSSQSGRAEVYVRPYPGGEPAVQVSTDGGVAPIWSRDGKTLFFSNPAGVFMAVDVAPGPEFRPGRVRHLPVSPALLTSPVRGHDNFPDGSFVTAAADPDASDVLLGVAELQIMLNFAAVVAERVGRGK